jgi:tRNA (cmo5U34)-methyltransferase
MSKQADTLYACGHAPAPFRFNRQVAQVFDDMIHRSVPLYDQAASCQIALLASRLAPGDTVYDLGCATGATLVAIARQIPGLRLVGIDSAPAMLEQARAKASKAGVDIQFIHADVAQADLDEPAAVLCNYTMQFIPVERRRPFLARIHRALQGCGLLLLCEKIVSPCPLLEAEFVEQHHAFKRAQGYSDLEIARKREALESVLTPLSRQENLDMLRRAGFTEADCFLQWFNFAAFAAIKGEE